MALNFWSYPIFQSCLAEESLVFPMGIGSGFLRENLPDRSLDMINRSWDSRNGVENHFDYGGSNVCGDDSHESVYRDIIDLLPADPFGMGISSSFTAITEFIGNLEFGTYKSADSDMTTADCTLFEELKMILDQAMAFQAFPENSDEVTVAGRTEEHFREDFWSSFCYGDFGPVNSMEQIHFGSGTSRLGQSHNLLQKISADVDVGGPHPALAFALAYLGVHDLLCMEMVCRSLRYSVKNDPLLWKSIHIDQPLNDRITDDVLLQLTIRAQGNLQCLSLIDCKKISDDGLKQVLNNNLRLTKLCVSGCTKLSIDGVVNSLRAFNSVATIGIKHLRVGGLYNVKHNHFEEFKSLLGIAHLKPASGNKQHFYHRGNTYISFDDDRALDIEMCPRCQTFRLVYDCPLKSCKGKNHESQICRACTLCIPRCVECGRCIFDDEYEELFSLDFLCLLCGKDQSKFQERQIREVSPSNHIDQDESYSSQCQRLIWMEKVES
ncbi:hypothetical protein Dimus_031870 [Dionaea muscipula]